jgi:hypothetical protein
MRNHLFSALAALSILGIGSTSTAFAHGHHHGPSVATCHETALICARVVTPTFAPDGKLWITWVAGDRVSIASSTDLARTYTTALTLPATKLPIDNGPDARPKIAVGADGRIVVAYTTRDDKYNGHAFIVRSADGGKTFSDPQPITANSPSQRFEAVGINKDGRVFAAWIDKRDVAAAKAAGKPYAGAALAFAWDGEPGGPLKAATIARDNTCECCRIALAFAAPDKPAVLFRNIFDGGIRDHAIITFSGDRPGPLYRISDDDAKIDACPHQGPSLAIGGDGTYHATWFALGRKLKGLYYARSADGARTFSTPMPLGSPDTQTSRPYVLAAGNVVYLAYKSFDGEKTSIDVMTSRDSGKTWSKAHAVAETAGPSDHPLLVANNSTAYLSWLTAKDGYRLIALEPQS